MSAHEPAAHPAPAHTPPAEAAHAPAHPAAHAPAAHAAPSPAEAAHPPAAAPAEAHAGAENTNAQGQGGKLEKFFNRFFKKTGPLDPQVLISHEEKTEKRIRAYIFEHALDTAKALYAHRGRKIRAGALPDVKTLAAHIAAGQLMDLAHRGQTLLDRARKGGEPHHYSALTLGFASYAAEQFGKGPFATKHRLGGWSDLAHHAYGGLEGASLEAKRLRQFYGSLGVRRLWTRHVKYLPDGWLLHRFTSKKPPVRKPGRKIPIISPVLGWFSGRRKLRAIKPLLNGHARYGLGLQRLPPKGFAAQTMPLSEQHRLVEAALAKKNPPKAEAKKEEKGEAAEGEKPHH